MNETKSPSPKELGSLNELSGYSTQIDFYNSHKDKPWKNWLEFETTFDKPGKQGLVGILHSKEDKENKFVFKLSQYINYLTEHEYTVMNGLVELSPYCPHFCKPIGVISCEVDARVRKNGNPFTVENKHPIEKEVLLTEFIDKSCKFYNYIRSEKVPDKVIYSSIKQVMMAINIAQKKKKFTHYDLHSYNIMMKKCDKDVVFLYVVDEENQYCVPTYGHYPVIIDFGFSFIENMNGNYLWPSLAHTDVGFFSDRFDWVADPKLFLTTVSTEVKSKRDGKNSKKLRNIVKNIFGTLDIDWSSGWDKSEEKGASDYVIDLLEDYNTESELFDNYDHYCIDLIQSLVILPLEKQSYSNIGKAYQAFIKEFIKIEREIANPFYSLYVLKGVVDVAREVRSDYINKTNRKHALKFFSNCVLERIDCIAKFCNPKDLDMEKLLCTLLYFSRCVEGILYDVMYTKTKKKERAYSKLPLQSVSEIYGVIEVNIPDEYVYNSNTKVFILDSVRGGCDIMDMKEEWIEEINDTHPLARGTHLYNLYNSTE